MAKPPRVMNQAMWAAGALVLCALAANRLLEPNPLARHVMFPGSSVVPFLYATVSVGATGARHNIDSTMLLVLASIINFVCYLVAIYICLSMSIRNRDLKIRT